MLMSEKLVEHANLKTLHLGVGCSIAEVRERFWISNLRHLVKNVKLTNAMDAKYFEQ